MEKEEQLESKLIKDIEKTGYPVELRAGNAFAKAGWNVQYNTYYTDWDEGKGREIDLTVCNAVWAKKHHIGVTVYLFCEVKKSVDPWVIFTAKNAGEMEGLEQPGWSRLHLAFDEIDYLVLPGEKIDANSTIAQFQRFGHSYYVAFCGTQSKPTIFEALTSSVKASVDHLMSINKIIKNDEVRTGKPQTKGRHLVFFEPIIILDGLLYETYLDRHNKLVTHRVNHIPVCFGYVSPKYSSGEFSPNYVVEIVTMDSLPKLISKKMEWLNSIKGTIVNNISKKESIPSPLPPIP
jgi:hypothetical protein